MMGLTEFMNTTTKEDKKMNEKAPKGPRPEYPYKNRHCPKCNKWMYIWEFEHNKGICIPCIDSQNSTPNKEN